MPDDAELKAALEAIPFAEVDRPLKVERGKHKGDDWLVASFGNDESFEPVQVTTDGVRASEHVADALQDAQLMVLAPRLAGAFLRLLRERDELAVELMDNSISAAAVAIQLRRERDEARARLASAQHDAEVYRDAVIEARELAYSMWPHYDLLRVDLLRIFEDLHGLPALDADQGEGEGT